MNLSRQWPKLALMKMDQRSKHKNRVIAVLLIAAVSLVLTPFVSGYSCPTNEDNFELFCICSDGSREYVRSTEEWFDLREEPGSCCYINQETNNAGNIETQDTDSEAVEIGNEETNTIVEIPENVAKLKSSSGLGVLFSYFDSLIFDD